MTRERKIHAPSELGKEIKKKRLRGNLPTIVIKEKPSLDPIDSLREVVDDEILQNATACDYLLTPNGNVSIFCKKDNATLSLGIYQNNQRIANFNYSSSTGTLYNPVLKLMPNNKLGIFYSIVKPNQSGVIFRRINLENNIEELVVGLFGVTYNNSEPNPDFKVEILSNEGFLVAFPNEFGELVLREYNSDYVMVSSPIITNISYTSTLQLAAINANLPSSGKEVFFYFQTFSDQPIIQRFLGRTDKGSLMLSGFQVPIILNEQGNIQNFKLVKSSAIVSNFNPSTPSTVTYISYNESGVIKLQPIAPDGSLMRLPFVVTDPSAWDYRLEFIAPVANNNHGGILVGLTDTLASVVLDGTYEPGMKEATYAQYFTMDLDGTIQPQGAQFAIPEGITQIITNPYNNKILIVRQSPGEVATADLHLNNVPLASVSPTPSTSISASFTLIPSVLSSASRSISRSASSSISQNVVPSVSLATRSASISAAAIISPAESYIPSQAIFISPTNSWSVSPTSSNLGQITTSSSPSATPTSSPISSQIAIGLTAGIVSGAILMIAGIALYYLYHKKENEHKKTQEDNDGSIKRLKDFLDREEGNFEKKTLFFNHNSWHSNQEEHPLIAISDLKKEKEGLSFNYTILKGNNGKIQQITKKIVINNEDGKNQIFEILSNNTRKKAQKSFCLGLINDQIHLLTYQQIIDFFNKIPANQTFTKTQYIAFINLLVNELRTEEQEYSFILGNATYIASFQSKAEFIFTIKTNQEQVSSLKINPFEILDEGALLPQILLKFIYNRVTETDYPTISKYYILNELAKIINPNLAQSTDFRQDHLNYIDLSSLDQDLADFLIHQKFVQAQASAIEGIKEFIQESSRVQSFSRDQDAASSSVDIITQSKVQIQREREEKIDQEIIAAINNLNEDLLFDSLKEIMLLFEKKYDLAQGVNRHFIQKNSFEMMIRDAREQKFTTRPLYPDSRASFQMFILSMVMTALKLADISTFEATQAGKAKLKNILLKITQLLPSSEFSDIVKFLESKIPVVSAYKGENYISLIAEDDNRKSLRFDYSRVTQSGRYTALQELPTQENFSQQEQEEAGTDTEIELQSISRGSQNLEEFCKDWRSNYNQQSETAKLVDQILNSMIKLFIYKCDQSTIAKIDKIIYTESAIQTQQKQVNKLVNKRLKFFKKEVFDKAKDDLMMEFEGKICATVLEVKINETHTTGQTFIVLEVPMSGLTDQQKVDWRKVRDSNILEKEALPIWFQKLPHHRQEALRKIATKVLKGIQTHPTQWKDGQPGLKNAFCTIVLSFNIKTLEFKELDYQYHAGAIATFGKNNKENQRIANQNARQLQIIIGGKEGATIFFNTLNSPNNIADSKDSQIFAQSRIATSAINGYYANTAFNAWREIGPNYAIWRQEVPFLGSSSYYEQISHFLEDLSSELNLNNVTINRYLIASNISNELYTSCLGLVESLELDAKIKEILTRTLRLKSIINHGIGWLDPKLEDFRKKSNAKNKDPENTSLKIVVELGALIKEINISKVTLDLNQQSKLLKKIVFIILCASGKDRTQLAMIERLSDLIAEELLNDLVRIRCAIDTQTEPKLKEFLKQRAMLALLLGGHAQNQNGSVVAAGCNVATFATKIENFAGLPQSTRSLLKFFISKLADLNKLNEISKESLKDILTEALLSLPEIGERMTLLEDQQFIDYFLTNEQQKNFAKLQLKIASLVEELRNMEGANVNMISTAIEATKSSDMTVLKATIKSLEQKIDKLKELNEIKELQAEIFKLIQEDCFKEEENSITSSFVFSHDDKGNSIIRIEDEYYSVIEDKIYLTYQGKQQLLDKKQLKTLHSTLQTKVTESKEKRIKAINIQIEDATFDISFDKSLTILQEANALKTEFENKKDKTSKDWDSYYIKFKEVGKKLDTLYTLITDVKNIKKILESKDFISGNIEMRFNQSNHLTISYNNSDLVIFENICITYANYELLAEFYDATNQLKQQKIKELYNLFSTDEGSSFIFNDEEITVSEGKLTIQIRNQQAITLDSLESSESLPLDNSSKILTPLSIEELANIIKFVESKKAFINRRKDQIERIKKLVKEFEFKELFEPNSYQLTSDPLKIEFYNKEITINTENIIFKSSENNIKEIEINNFRDEESLNLIEEELTAFKSSKTKSITQKLLISYFHTLLAKIKELPSDLGINTKIKNKKWIIEITGIEPIILIEETFNTKSTQETLQFLKQAEEHFRIAIKIDEERKNLDLAIGRIRQELIFTSKTYVTDLNILRNEFQKKESNALENEKNRYKVFVTSLNNLIKITQDRQEADYSNFPQDESLLNFFQSSKEALCEYIPLIHAFNSLLETGYYGDIKGYHSDNNKEFKLQDYVVKPFQRILKYGLFYGEIINKMESFLKIAKNNGGENLQIVKDITRDLEKIKRIKQEITKISNEINQSTNKLQSFCYDLTTNDLSLQQIYSVVDKNAKETLEIYDRIYKTKQVGATDKAFRSSKIEELISELKNLLKNGSENLPEYLYFLKTIDVLLLEGKNTLDKAHFKQLEETHNQLIEKIKSTTINAEQINYLKKISYQSPSLSFVYQEIYFKSLPKTNSANIDLIIKVITESLKSGLYGDKFIKSRINHLLKQKIKLEDIWPQDFQFDTQEGIIKAITFIRIADRYNKKDGDSEAFSSEKKQALVKMITDYIDDKSNLRDVKNNASDVNYCCELITRINKINNYINKLYQPEYLFGSNPFQELSNKNNKILNFSIECISKNIADKIKDNIADMEKNYAKELKSMIDSIGLLPQALFKKIYINTQNLLPEEIYKTKLTILFEDSNRIQQNRNSENYANNNASPSSSTGHPSAVQQQGLIRLVSLEKSF
jgi:hypothetical protein